jgi:hypothetical protein
MEKLSDKWVPKCLNKNKKPHTVGKEHNAAGAVQSFSKREEQAVDRDAGVITCVCKMREIYGRVQNILLRYSVRTTSTSSASTHFCVVRLLHQQPIIINFAALGLPSSSILILPPLISYSSINCLTNWSVYWFKRIIHHTFWDCTAAAFLFRSRQLPIRRATYPTYITFNNNNMNMLTLTFQATGGGSRRRRIRLGLLLWISAKT